MWTVIAILVLCVLTVCCCTFCFEYAAGYMCCLSGGYGAAKMEFLSLRGVALETAVSVVLSQTSQKSHTQFDGQKLTTCLQK